MQNAFIAEMLKYIDLRIRGTQSYLIVWVVIKENDLIQNKLGQYQNMSASIDV